MTNQIQNPNDKKRYDLTERTGVFGEHVIEFVRRLSDDAVNRSLISQLVRAGTSIGANYMEADVAESRKDFFHKIGIAKKEAKETLHWFRMIAKANLNCAKECRVLWREAQELVLIFAAITKNKAK